MNSYVRSLFAVALVAACRMTFAQVTPEEHAAHHPDEKAAPAQQEASGVKSDSAADPVGVMRTRMKAMQGLLDKLAQTRDPAARQRLLAEHRDAMRQQLQAMKTLQCPMMGMTGSAPGDDASPADKDAMKKGAMQGGMMGGSMMNCHDRMEARMELMADMFEQMLRREEARTAVKP